MTPWLQFHRRRNGLRSYDVWVRASELAAFGLEEEGLRLYLTGGPPSMLVAACPHNQDLVRPFMADPDATETAQGEPSFATLFTTRQLLQELRDFRTEVRMDLATLQGQLDTVRGIVTTTGTSLTAIAADIQRIKDSIPTTGGLTEAEAQTLSSAIGTLQAQVQAVADAAATIDASTPETPVTPEG